ncbi:hypothetical protein SOP85_01385 [Pseudomonas sp. YuFO20]|uniref:hypothetical protein n=1 Tax=Pseudomonas sp. YuFO20 TaxID=3095362 RepID=UPI002B25205C|nr:hypothetical protein [Pseudomonas sp. YuFO20]MEB2514097.1 hypothetical protein [Pseudomonas sp. YuFO20]
MDQITGNPRNHDEGTSGWKFAHQRLSQMLIERVEPFGSPFRYVQRLAEIEREHPALTCCKQAAPER